MQRDDEHPTTLPGIWEWPRRRDDDAHVRSGQLGSNEVCLPRTHNRHPHRCTRDRLDFLLQLQKARDNVCIFRVNDQR